MRRDIFTHPPCPASFKKVLSILLTTVLIASNGPSAQAWDNDRSSLPGSRNNYTAPNRPNDFLNQGNRRFNDREEQRFHLVQAGLDYRQHFSVHNIQPSVPLKVSVFKPLVSRWLSPSRSDGGLSVLSKPLGSLSQPLSVNRAQGENKSFSTSLTANKPSLQAKETGLAKKEASPLAQLKTPANPQALLPDAGLSKELKTGLPGAGAISSSGLTQRLDQAWDGLVKGQKTVAEVRTADGRLLKGAVQVNRAGEILAIQPGTVMAMGEAPAQVGGALWKQGNFVTRDGQTFNLIGQGTQITDKLPDYKILGQGLEVHMNGDGTGNNKPIGFGPLQEGNQLQHENTGLTLTYHPADSLPGSWNLDGDQKDRIPVAAKVLDIGLDPAGLLAKPLDVSIFNGGQEQKVQVAGVLANLETGGFQLLAQTQAPDNVSLRLDGLTGAEPGDKVLPAGFLTARQEIAVSKHLSSFQTNAKIRQEGDGYVLSGGPVALNITTNKDGSEAYIGAVLGSGSQLTVTGPTYLPGPDMTIYAGKFTMGEQWSGAYNLEPGTLYEDRSGTFVLIPDAEGTAKPLPVKDLNLEQGTFTALIVNQPIEGDMGLEYLELPGKIDFENGKASLIKQAVAAEVTQLTGLFQPSDIRDMGELRSALQRDIPGNEVLWQTIGITSLPQAWELTEQQALHGLNKALSVPDLHAYLDLKNVELDSKTESLLDDAQDGEKLSLSDLRTLNRALLTKVYREALKPSEISPKDAKDKSLRIFYVSEGGVLKQGPRVPKKNFEELQGLRPDAKPSIFDYAWNAFRNNPITFVIRGAFDAARTVMSVVFGGRILEEPLKQYDPVTTPDDLMALMESGQEGVEFFQTQKPVNPDDPPSAVFEVRRSYKTPPLLNVLPHAPFIKMQEEEVSSAVGVYFNNAPASFVNELKTSESIDVFVHGYNVGSNKSLDLRRDFEESFVRQGYSNVNSLITWSGDVGNNFLSKGLYFNRSAKSADLSWEGVAKTADFIRSYNPDIKINVTTHSLGARLILDAANHGVRMGTVILLVPAVDNEVLSTGGKYEKALQNIDHLVVVYSKNQELVFGAAYRAARFDRALGYVGPAGKVPANVTVIDATKASDRNMNVEIDNHGDIFEPATVKMIINYLKPKK